jgi:hypothetical protein
VLRDGPSGIAPSGSTPFSVQSFDGPSLPEASPAHFTELNPFMAGLPIQDSAASVVPSGVSGTRYLNLVASAQLLQTLGTAPDSNISIAPDDGRLVVQRWRPPAP